MKHALMLAFAAALLSVAATPVMGVGTPVGTTIDNVAEVSFDLGGTPVTQNTNTVTITVVEVLDVNLLIQTPQRTVMAGDSGQPLLYTLTNTGNGSEVFQLASNNVVPGDDFDPTPASPDIYFDTDGSGDLSPADTPYNPGGNDPNLAADESIDILLVHDIPLGLPDGSRGIAELSATAATGSGSPGDLFAGQGDGGLDAIVGASGAAQTTQGEYVVGNVGLDLVKSVVTADQFGGTQPIPGATVTYTVQVTATGTGVATNILFRDQIPVNTTYVAGSLQFNAAPLTDAVDADAGEYNAGVPEIVVRVPDLTAAAGSQTITFSVTID